MHQLPGAFPVGDVEYLNLYLRFNDGAELCGAGVEIQRDYDPSIPEIIGDREQLIQAVLNIARNAAQAGSGSINRNERSP